MAGKHLLQKRFLATVVESPWSMEIVLLYHVLMPFLHSLACQLRLCSLVWEFGCRLFFFWYAFIRWKENVISLFGPHVFVMKPIWAVNCPRAHRCEPTRLMAHSPQPISSRLPPRLHPFCPLPTLFAAPRKAKTLFQKQRGGEAQLGDSAALPLLASHGVQTAALGCVLWVLSFVHLLHPLF